MFRWLEWGMGWLPIRYLSLSHSLTLSLLLTRSHSNCVVFVCHRLCALYCTRWTCHKIGSIWLLSFFSFFLFPSTTCLRELRIRCQIRTVFFLESFSAILCLCFMVYIKLMRRKRKYVCEHWIKLFYAINLSANLHYHNWTDEEKYLFKI